MLIFKRAVVLAIVAADSCIAAYAAPAVPLPSVRVSVKDLNLTTHAGAAMAYVRIRNAARSVCGVVDLALTEERFARDKCVDAAILRAVAELASPTLTEYYWAKTRGVHRETMAQISKRTELGN